MISPFYIVFALSQKVWFFSVKLTKKRAFETKRKKNIYSYIIKGLLHWYRWILSLVAISTDARKLASFDIPTRNNIHRYQCNNPLISYNIMRKKGSFWNWYKMMEIIKALKCCQDLYQVVVCPYPGAIYMFEIVKKCKLSLPAQDQLSGERYRTVGLLVKRGLSLYKTGVFIAVVHALAT